MGIFEAILRLLTALSGISGCWYMFKSSDPALILDKLGKLCETGGNGGYGNYGYRHSNQDHDGD